MGHRVVSGTETDAVFPGASRRAGTRVDVKVVGVAASPKHITAISGRRAVHALVGFVSMAAIVCATAPVCGGDNTRPPTESTRRARAFETRVLVGRHPDDPARLKSAPVPQEIIERFMRG